LLPKKRTFVRSSFMAAFRAWILCVSRVFLNVAPLELLQGLQLGIMLSSDESPPAAISSK
jgi:hypothetical protein